MDSISTSESKMFEEMYLTLQLILAIVLLNEAFPLFGKPDATVYTAFGLAFFFYVVGKIGWHMYRLVFRGQPLNAYPNRLATLIDGFFAGGFIYMEWMLYGHNLLSLFYMYVILQGIRYHGRNPWIFSIFPALLHGYLIVVARQESVLEKGHIVDILMYFLLALFIEWPFRQLKAVHKERQYY